MKSIRRREILDAIAVTFAGGLSGGLLPACATAALRSARDVVVVGGGFAGATCARTLKKLDPNLDVTLLEPKQTYVACPFSNLVIAGERSLSAQTFDYATVDGEGIRHLAVAALDVDPVARKIRLQGGSTLRYDKLVMAPGISLNFSALPGYDKTAVNSMPHAWQAGPQTVLLARQLAAMKDGGRVVIVVPANPYRCPPGPYERASLIAAYLKKHKPRSKLLILDSKDRFSKQSLFQAAWQSEYGNMIEWQGLSDGARVVSVDPRAMTLQTDFEVVVADVANVIPPQRAGVIAHTAGLTDASGWCPIEAASFESTLVPDIHVIGDAAIANAMPKSAFAANAQGKLCAVQVGRALNGLAPIETKLINNCYSLVTPDYGISVAGVYQPQDQQWLEIKGAGGTSRLDSSIEVRHQEARYARDWYTTITREVFG